MKRSYERILALLTLLGLSLALLAAPMPSPARSAPRSEDRLSQPPEEKVRLGCGGSPGIHVLPPGMLTPRDTVLLNFSGTWSDACVPGLKALRSENRIITLELETYDAYCLQVITPWEYLVNAGRLPPGHYEAQLIISGPGGLNPSLCATTSFLVSGARILIPAIYHDGHLGNEPD